ncbi:MAG: hypothetical protein RQ966_15185 [Acetobacteraceae bacterium]|nr:hypothetical protein [Acetobacteraceae bacterium]
MRKLLFAVALGGFGVALLPSHEARAWWDHWGRWHPGRPGPRVIVGPPVYAPVPYPGPRYARWIPPHYNRFGYFVPGHWG